jgi:hypothetical protein
MLRVPALIAISLAPLLLGGCLAKAAVDVATAPVRLASRTVDLATTSQSEADEKRGRELRRREERLGRLERDYRKQADRCDDDDEDACRRAEQVRAEIDDLQPSIPVERER